MKKINTSSSRRNQQQQQQQQQHHNQNNISHPSQSSPPLSPLNNHDGEITMNKSPLRRLKSIARLSSAFSFEDSDGNLQVKPTTTSRLHTRCINVVRISTSQDMEPFVASAGLDCLLIFSKYHTGEIIKQIDTEDSFVFDISISQSTYQSIVATASQDGVIRIYDAKKHFDCIRAIKLRSDGVCPIIWSVQLFRDRAGNSFCISGGANKTIHVINWRTQQEVCILSGHKEGVRCLAIAEDGIIASGSNDHSVKLWNFQEQKFLQTFRGHTAEVNAVVFVPQTSFLFTACENNLFRQWNYHTGERVRVFHDYNGASILTLAVVPVPGNPLILVGGTVSEKSIAPLVPLQVWDVNTATLVSSCVGTRYQISSASARYDSETKTCVVVGGGLDSTIRMWQLTSAMIPALNRGGDDDGEDIFEEDEEDEAEREEEQKREYERRGGGGGGLGLGRGR